MSEKRTFKRKNAINNKTLTEHLIKEKKRKINDINVHKQTKAMNNHKISQNSNLTCEEKTSKKACKGEKNMKNIIMTVLITMILGLMLTGCDAFRQDGKNATVSVTTSSGQSYVYQSVNGSSSTLSGKELALKDYKLKLNLKTGETAHIVFKCEACGNEQEFDIDNAWADVISCDCPEKLDKDGNAREYAAIEVTYNQEE